MTTIQIKHRFTGAVLYEYEATEDQVLQGIAMREALYAAIKARAYLADANLADACLAGANLAGANLAGANLARANLARAYLAGARNVPNGAAIVSPEAPYQRDTRPAEERYADRAAKFRKENPRVPVVDALDSQILSKVEANPNALEMGAWHTCETTHCRAGWAIALAGKAGFELEEERGSQLAGRMIYLASTGRAPNFFATNENALADIKRCAALEKK